MALLSSCPNQFCGCSVTHMPRTQSVPDGEPQPTSQGLAGWGFSSRQLHSPTQTHIHSHASANTHLDFTFIAVMTFEDMFWCIHRKYTRIMLRVWNTEHAYNRFEYKYCRSDNQNQLLLSYTIVQKCIATWLKCFFYDTKNILAIVWN